MFLKLNLFIKRKFRFDHLMKIASHSSEGGDVYRSNCQKRFPIHKTHQNNLWIKIKEQKNTFTEGKFHQTFLC